jgi:hypothetical protein
VLNVKGQVEEKEMVGQSYLLQETIGNSEHPFEDPFGWAEFVLDPSFHEH